MEASGELKTFRFEFNVFDGGIVNIAGIPASPADLRALSDEAETIKDMEDAGASDDELAALGYDLGRASVVLEEPGPKRSNGNSTPLKHKSEASGVALTPQNPNDRRREISETGGRNKHLMEAERRMFRKRSKEHLLKLIYRGIKKDVTSRAVAKYERNKIEDEKAAKEEFSNACASCGVDGCKIKDQFPKFARVHGQANATTNDQEDSRDWQGRLLDATTNGKDPNLVPCLPPKSQ